MKDITYIEPPESDEEIQVNESPSKKEEIKPKDNTMSIVLLILVTLVLGVIVWYKLKQEDK